MHPISSPSLGSSQFTWQSPVKFPKRESEQDEINLQQADLPENNKKQNPHSEYFVPLGFWGSCYEVTFHPLFPLISKIAKVAFAKIKVIAEAAFAKIKVGYAKIKERFFAKDKQEQAIAPFI
jgi:hypothetical protein